MSKERFRSHPQSTPKVHETCLGHVSQCLPHGHEHMLSKSDVQWLWTFHGIKIPGGAFQKLCFLSPRLRDYASVGLRWESEHSISPSDSNVQPGSGINRGCWILTSSQVDDYVHYLSRSAAVKPVEHKFNNCLHQSNCLPRTVPGPVVSAWPTYFKMPTPRPHLDFLDQRVHMWARAVLEQPSRWLWYI